MHMSPAALKGSLSTNPRTELGNGFYSITFVPEEAYTVYTDDNSRWNEFLLHRIQALKEFNELHQEDRAALLHKSHKAGPDDTKRWHRDDKPTTSHVQTNHITCPYSICETSKFFKLCERI
jgi:hypothetical protein